MPNSVLSLPDAAEERELFALVKRERHARDTGNFELMRSLYWEGGIVRVTWFEGTIDEFIEVSRDAHQRGRGRGIHVINPIRCEVSADGRRAIVESQGEIHIRPRLQDVFCDVVSWCRFFSRAEKRDGDGQWRLVTFDSIYCKDRIDPVDPQARLVLDQGKLEAGRPSYRHLRYLNLSANFTVPDDLPGDDRPELVAAFYADAAMWMNLQE